MRLLDNWYLRILERFGLVHRRDVIYKLRNGLKLKMQAHKNYGDVLILWDVYVNQTYTRSTFKLSQNDVVVDIGAHVGIFATYAAKHCKAVYAYEPSPDSFAYLRYNADSNGLENLRCFNCAVSDRQEPVTLFLSKAGSGVYSIYGRKHSSGEMIRVPSTRLADILSENRLVSVDLLKMDCEGAEYEILYGASPEVLARVRRIAVEAHRIHDHSEGELASFLMRHGFRVSLPSRHILYAEQSIP